MEEQTDEILMYDVASGNLDSMSVIFDRYHKRIYNFYYQLLRDGPASEDLTQNVFYKVIRYKHTYKGGKFVSWIFKIARNIYADYYNKNGKTQSFDDIKFASDIKTSDELEESERLSHLFKVLDKLEDEDKELIMMNRLQNIKYDELATIVGSNSNAVKTRVHRIIKKLRLHYFEMV